MSVFVEGGAPTVFIGPMTSLPIGLASFADRHRDAIAMQRAGMFEAAVFAYRALLAESPNDATVHNNLGTALGPRGYHADALEHFRRAIELQPAYVDANANVAVTLWAMRRYDEAEAHTLEALAAMPDAALLRKTLGVLRLQRGDYAGGWPEYEQRFEADRVTRLHAHLPRWQGGPWSGPLLVWAEQGVGDEVMYLSMMPDLLRLGGEVWLACDTRFAPLFARSFPGVRLFPRWATPIPGAALEIPIASLGGVLRRSADDFPVDRLSYLRPDLARAAEYQCRLGGDRLVGISWSSSGSAFAAGKSAQLRDFAALAAVPGVRLVNLQYGDTDLERTFAGFEVASIDGLDLRNDFDGLAALISACDEVVSISNVTAHLAGALGRPTTVMAPAGLGHLWFWGREGESTPWYPMVRVERQALGEPWSSVVSRVAVGLV